MAWFRARATTPPDAPAAPVVDAATARVEARSRTQEAVLSIQEIDAAVQALASTQQAIDGLVQERRFGR